MSGDRSDTCVPLQYRDVSFIPSSGDRSDTFVVSQFKLFRGIRLTLPIGRSLGAAKTRGLS